MSGGHFGSGYWPEGYYGPYWQAVGGGGVIIGALAGSFAGASAFALGLQGEPQVEQARRVAGGGRRRVKDRYGRDVIVVRDPPQPDPAEIAKPAPAPVVVRVKTLPERRSIEAELAALIEEEDELILLLAA